MKDNELIEYLRNEEERFVPDVPEGLWDDIERNLPQAAKRRWVVPMWLRYSGVAASLALLFGVGTLFIGSPSDDTPDEHIAKRESVVEKACEEERQTATGPIIARAKTAVSQCETVSTVQVIAASADTVASMDEEKQSEPTAPSRQTGDDTHRDKPHSHYWLASEVKKSSSRDLHGLSVSLYAAGIMSSNATIKNSFMVSDALSPSESTENSPYDDIIDLNEGVDMDTKKHYDLPLRAGIRLSIPITSSVDIESGLTYTLLSSSIESGSIDNYYRTEQRLHYVGIPLKLRCKLWKGKRACVYVSGGGMVEKCVSGKAETNFFIGGKLNSTEKQCVSEKPIQLSATLSAGVEAIVMRNVSLFVEPGASYYIDNNSSVDNIYKDKPLNFDLNIGVRIDLNK